MNKPGLPQGTRDFGPETVRRRNYIYNTVRTVFELYGFQPLETPAMENLDTLMGKYGEEGDRLIFKILNNGLSDPRNSDKARAGFEAVLSGRNDKNLTERALKYDLTIPFARYIAMNHGQLTFPFKRYQIQPVWRADRPQKGRYREFYQCDADVVGSTSLLNEVELTHIYYDVFSKLRLEAFSIAINNRKILRGIMEVCGIENRERSVLVIIDKTDKIGKLGVREELEKEGIQPATLEQLMLPYTFEGSNTEKLKFLREFLTGSTTGLQGVAEMKYLLDRLDGSPPSAYLTLDLTLARGLEYYTGTIFEVRGPASVKMGSIGGGGRYDDLTGLFGVPGIPGVGISFGVDRIYDVLDELGLFPEHVSTGTQVLFFNLGEEESRQSFSLMQVLRERGVRCEIYPEQARFDKQFKYADRRHIRYAVIVGTEELEQGTCVIRDLQEGKQETKDREGLLATSFE